MICIVQKNRNFLKEYWILRNILLPFNRIRIWFSNILLPLKGSRIRVVKILLKQNFNRIFRFWQPLVKLRTRCPICEIFLGQPLIKFAVCWGLGSVINNILSEKREFQDIVFSTIMSASGWSTRN